MRNATGRSYPVKSDACNAHSSARYRRQEITRLCERPHSEAADVAPASKRGYLTSAERRRCANSRSWLRSRNLSFERPADPVGTPHVEFWEFLLLIGDDNLNRSAERRSWFWPQTARATSLGRCGRRAVPSEQICGDGRCIFTQTSCSGRRTRERLTRKSDATVQRRPCPDPLAAFKHRCDPSRRRRENGTTVIQLDLDDSRLVKTSF
jgi:hypothetical protein